MHGDSREYIIHSRIHSFGVSFVSRYHPIPTYVFSLHLKHSRVCVSGLTYIEDNRFSSRKFLYHGQKGVLSSFPAGFFFFKDFLIQTFPE